MRCEAHPGIFNAQQHLIGCFALRADLQPPRAIVDAGHGIGRVEYQVQDDPVQLDAVAAQRRQLQWKFRPHRDPAALQIAHDQYNSDGHAIGAMRAMQAMGVNALDRRHPVEKFLREAAVFPLYDAGNIGMQMRKIWGVMLDEGFDSRGSHARGAG
jgi:hypothetical protein